MRLKSRLVVTEVRLTPGTETVTFASFHDLINDTGAVQVSVPNPYGGGAVKVAPEIASQFSVGAEFTS